MNRVITHRSLILCLLLICSLGWRVAGQGWEKTYGHPDDANAYQIEQTPDLGYLILGSTADSLIEIKVDANGVEQSRTVASLGNNMVVKSNVHKNAAGEYLVGGQSVTASTNNVCLYKTNADGDSLWFEVYHSGYQAQSSTESGIYDLKETPDGGYILAGSYLESYSVPEMDALLFKTDSLGQLVWNLEIGSYSQSPFQYYYGRSVDLTHDGHYAIGGHYNSGSTGYFLAKVDAGGQLLWKKEYLDSTYSQNYFLITTQDKGFLLGGRSLVTNNFQGSVVRTDSLGDTLWSAFLGGVGVDQFKGAVETADGGFVLVGATTLPQSPYTEVFLVKYDAAGNLKWSRSYGSPDRDWGHAVIQTADGGYALAGSMDDAATSSDFYVIKTDSGGNSFSHFLQGYAFADDNTNCLLDAGEMKLNGWIVEAQKAGRTFYGVTDSLGFYSIRVDTGIYDFQIFPSSAYWEASPCGSNAYTIPVTTTYDTTEIHFPQAPAVVCPAMVVNVGTPFIRRCFDNTYTVTYANQGTADADSVYVTVQFDPAFSVDSTSILWSIAPEAGLYTFFLDTVAMNQSGQFQIHGKYDCDSTVLGQAYCVEARITPDSSCLPPDPVWDGSEIAVEGNCLSDSTLEFKVRNLRQYPMAHPIGVTVTEDNVMKRIDSVQFNGVDTAIFVFPASGGTWRLEAEQSIAFPGRSRPSITLEGCGTDSLGNFSTGFVTTFPHDDLDPFVSIDCQEVIGSFDPNNKVGFPKGVGTAKFISDSTRLQYQINFQNTGTDTAFLVIIRDTLSAYLNPTTIRMAGGSHPYAWNMAQNGILEFTFSPIELPDSNINEPASHGFVKFTVEQQPGNHPDMRIENRAAIFFDYNAPVITNTEFNTIGDDLLDTLLMASVSEVYTGVAVKAYPNPFSEKLTLIVEGPPPATMELRLFDLNGHLVRSEATYRQNKLVLERGDLLPGIYLFELSSPDHLPVRGKVMVIH